MPEELLVRYCAPTLAGLKTGSLFTCPCEDEEQLKREVREMNRCLSGKGLRVLPMRIQKGRALIYLYRPGMLDSDLTVPNAAELLRSMGYEVEYPNRCVARLGLKLRSGSGFPHEIGLFLGYPPADVLGFIENGPQSCLCSGLWKVYSDVEGAKRLFARYRSCTEDYWRRLKCGSRVEQLAVAGI